MAEGKLDSTGLTIPTYQEIVGDNGRAISKSLGVDLDLSPDSPIGAMNRTFGLTTYNLYQLLQAVYNARDISKATGTQLDNLGTYLGVTRLPAQPAVGFFSVFAQRNAFLPLNYRIEIGVGTPTVTYTAFSNSPTAVVIGDQTQSSSRFSNNVVLKFDESSVTNGNQYEIYVNNVVTNYEATAEDESDFGLFMENIRDALNSGGGDLDDGYICSIPSDSLQVGFLLIQSTTNNIEDYVKNGLNVDTVSPQSTVVYGATVNIYATTDEVGRDIKIPSNSSVSGGSLDNSLFVPDQEYRPPVFASANSDIIITQDWQNGQGIEDDSAYRARILGAGTEELGTFGAVYTNLLAVNGVSSLNIIENETQFVETVEGLTLPPRSFSAIVSGGNDNDVAQAIYNSKPIAVQSFGNQSGIAVDSLGSAKVINFNRPYPLYIALDVRLEIGSISSDLTESMISNLKDKLKTFGDSLAVGVDVVPSQFISVVYQTLPTTSWAEIKADSDSSPNFTPTYSSCRTFIPVNAESVFLISNINVVWEQCP